MNFQRATFILVFSSIFLGLPSAFADQAPIKILMGGEAVKKKLNDQKADLEKVAGGPVDLSISPFETALTPFIRGMVDGMTTGTTLEGTLAMAEKKGLGKLNTADFEMAELQRVIMKIGLHPANPVQALTKQQMTDIMTGKITTWESITGEKKPIHVLIARSYTAGVKAVAEAYTSGQPSKIATMVIDKEGVLRAMQNDPGAIGFFNEKDKLGSFEPKFIDSDAHFSTSLVIKTSARPEVKKVFNYLKKI